MIKRFGLAVLFGAVLLYAAGLSTAAQSGDSFALPDTPAARRIENFIKAFDSGDVKVMRDFHQNNAAEAALLNLDLDDIGQQDQAAMANFGKLTPRRVVESEPHSITVLLQAERGQWLRIRLDVEDRPPHKIIGLGFEPAEAPQRMTMAAPQQGEDRQPDMQIDAATRNQVIEELVKRLNASCVFPEVAAKMEQAIREHAKNKAYDQVTSAKEFARMLTEHLRAVSKDKHLHIDYSAEKIPIRPRSEPTPEEIQRFRTAIARMNYGFEKVERLPGNVGYLDLRGFMDPELGGETAAAAMTFLANSDALIIDLRRNGGGSPAMVAFITSYLFDAEPVHLNDIYWRPTNETRQWWTSVHVPGKRFGKDKPLYVLTSSRTFSAGEEFTYNLKNLKRAVIVGETTGGGAHPGGGQRLNDHFSVWVPSGRAINPITKTNWEGTGVEPDIKVPADQALKTAHAAALNKLIEHATDARHKEQLQRALASLGASSERGY